MKVSELILKIDDILGLDLAARLDTSAQSIEQAMAQDNCARTLLNCCNFVSDRMYCEYAVDCRTTVVEAADYVIDTQSLSISRVLSLVDSLGHSVPFRRSFDGLHVKCDGKYNLTYARLPRKLTFDSEIELFNSVITDRIYAYSVISEYLWVTGDYAQSELWQSKLNQALAALSVSKPAASMPARRWLS